MIGNGGICKLNIRQKGNVVYFQWNVMFRILLTHKTEINKGSQQGWSYKKPWTPINHQDLVSFFQWKTRMLCLKLLKIFKNEIV